MKETWSSQYRKPCVRLGGNETAEEVVEFANEIGARYHDGEDLCFVVDFNDEGRQVGPETYTERTLRSSLRRKPTSA